MHAKETQRGQLIHLRGPSCDGPQSRPCRTQAHRVVHGVQVTRGGHRATVIVSAHRGSRRGLRSGCATRRRSSHEAHRGAVRVDAPEAGPRRTELPVLAGRPPRAHYWQLARGGLVERVGGPVHRDLPHTSLERHSPRGAARASPPSDPLSSLEDHIMSDGALGSGRGCLSVNE